MKNDCNLLFILLISLTLSACVTINIYFPAAAAEKAADKIIEEVWQLDGAVRNDNESQKSEKPLEGVRP